MRNCLARIRRLPKLLGRCFEVLGGKIRWDGCLMEDVRAEEMHRLWVVVGFGDVEEEMLAA